MLLMAPYSAQTVAAQSIKCHSQRVGESLHILGWRSGDRGEMTPPPQQTFASKRP